VHSDQLITEDDVLLETLSTSERRHHEFSSPMLQANDPDLSLFKSGVYEQEHRLILDTMKACANRRKEVAEKLGISARTLRYKLARMRESGIQLPA